MTGVESFGVFILENGLARAKPFFSPKHWYLPTESRRPQYEFSIPIPKFGPLTWGSTASSVHLVTLSIFCLICHRLMEEQRFSFTKSLTVGPTWNRVTSSTLPPLCPIESFPLSTEKLSGRTVTFIEKVLRNEKILWRLLEVEPRIPVASRYTVVCFAITKNLARE